jgi:hypothetical protein
VRQSRKSRQESVGGYEHGPDRTQVARRRFRPHDPVDERLAGCDHHEGQDGALVVECAGTLGDIRRSDVRQREEGDAITGKSRGNAAKANALERKARGIEPRFIRNN